MVLDMGYWSKVIRRILMLVLAVVGVYFSFKLAVFYMPFLVAFVISLLAEPIIRIIMKSTKLSRRASSITVLSITIIIIIVLIGWGIAVLISESSNILKGLNDNIQKISTLAGDIINNVNLDKYQINVEVKNVLQDSVGNALSLISDWIKSFLTGLLQNITSIPKVGVYVVITILSTFFICMDRIFILDQIEHHFPTTWVKRFTLHTKKLIKSLGLYLKAEAILVGITFIEVTIGFHIIHIMGLGVEYPLMASLATGFVDALPILGAGSVLIPWAIISAVNGNITLAIALIILFVIVNVVKQIIEPKVVSNQIGIHPIFTLIAMYTGFRIIGIFGLLLGPIILIILENIFASLIDQGVLKAIFERK